MLKGFRLNFDYIRFVCFFSIDYLYLFINGCFINISTLINRDRQEGKFLKPLKLEIDDFQSDHFISYLYFRKKTRSLYAVDERSVYVK